MRLNIFSEQSSGSCFITCCTYPLFLPGFSFLSNFPEKSARLTSSAGKKCKTYFVSRKKVQDLLRQPGSTPVLFAKWQPKIWATKITKSAALCVVDCILLDHAFAWSKTMKNIRKSSKNVLFFMCLT